MPWPTPQDYNEAIQNPAFTFSDPELQSGSCEVTHLGLPKPITGNFASVYRLHCQGRDWAVRCFWRELSDMQQRYRAISAHLRPRACRTRWASSINHRESESEEAGIPFSRWSGSRASC